MSVFPDWLSATLASDAAEGQGVLPNTITTLRPTSRVVAPAHVVLMSRDDSLAVREALDHPPAPGRVLVAAGGGPSRTATIGGVVIREDDLVIADDGVVIWQAERVSDLLRKAEAKLRQDNVRLARLRGK